MLRDGAEDRRGRQIVVPQPMVDNLEMPPLDARSGIKADQRFREEIGALPPPAIPIVAWRGDREIEQSPDRIDAEWRPDVGVPGGAPRPVLPGVGALATLGDGAPFPDPPAGADVEGLDVAGRIVPIGEFVGDPVPDDHQIPIDDRWRRVGVALPVHGPDEVGGQIDFATLAKGPHRPAGRGVEGEESPAAVEEDPADPAIGPGGDAAVDESGAVRRLPGPVGPGVEPPPFPPGLGVERHHLVVRGAEIQRVGNHQRRGLEEAGPGLPGFERDLAGPPFPDLGHPGHVAAVDVGERRVLGGARIAAPGRPFAGLLGRQRGGAEDHAGQNE